MGKIDGLKYFRYFGALILKGHILLLYKIFKNLNFKVLTVTIILQN